MQILPFPIARNGHAGGKEGDVPHEGEADSKNGVGAKDLNRTEGTDDADQKRNEVCNRCYRNGNSCLGHHMTHALMHGHLGGSASPARQHHKGVINANA